MATSPVRVTDATAEPVLLETLKQFCRYEDQEDNTLLAEMGKAARKYCEAALGRSFLTQTWRLKLDSFDDPDYYREMDDSIRLPYPPLASVTSIVYLDSDGTSTTWASSEYVVDTDSEPGRVYPAWNESWPTTQVIPNAITFTYVAGATSAAAVPEQAKLAIMYLAKHFFDNRELVVATGAVPQEVPMTVTTLLRSVWHGEYC